MTNRNLGFQFDERTNLGQKNESQGTLFQVTQRPRSQKGPKGFSPERQDEVRWALGARPIPHGPDTGKLTENSNIHADVLPGQSPPESEGGWLTPRGLGQRRANQRAIQDMVSRSTAPPAGNVHISVVGPDDEGLKTKYTPEGASGVFRARGANGGTEPGVTVSRDAIDMKKGTSVTLLHELGHHDSYARRTEHSGVGLDGPRPDAASGREEAYADDFAATHARDKKGRGIGMVGKYPTTHRSMEFSQAYDLARTTPMQQPAKSFAEDERDYFGLPDHHVPGQTSFLWKSRDDLDSSVAPKAGTTKPKWTWGYQDWTGLDPSRGHG